MTRPPLRNTELDLIRIEAAHCAYLVEIYIINRLDG